MRPITAADDERIGTIARENLKAFGLDIPGTAYFDPEIMCLSSYNALAPERRAYFVVEDAEGHVFGGGRLAEFEPLEDTAELKESIGYIDWKQGFYDDVLAGRTEYYSNLIPADEWACNWAVKEQKMRLFK